MPWAMGVRFLFCDWLGGQEIKGPSTSGKAAEERWIRNWENCGSLCLIEVSATDTSICGIAAMSLFSNCPCTVHEADPLVSAGLFTIATSSLPLN